MRRPWFVFAGGGTAGHLFPALGVVESLRSRDLPIDISFFCTNRPGDSSILEPAGVECIAQSVRPLTANPRYLPAMAWHWMKSLSLCKQMFDRRRPALVVGAGGYASGPPVKVAVKLDIPTFLLNPDAVPGRANRYLARQGKLSGIFAQWPVTTSHFPPNAPLEVTGCPVRKAFRAPGGVDVRAVIQSFGLDPDRRTLLITGASQGARTINEAMMKLAGLITSSNWQALHLSGRADCKRVTRAYADARTKAVVLPFTDRMADAMSAADLIVSRAGASTLAEIVALGKPAILLPYPFHRDRHQWHNGRVLLEAGAAEMLEDLKQARANADNLGPILATIIADDRRREIMSKKALKLARPKAADQVADRLWQTAGGKAR